MLSELWEWPAIPTIIIGELSRMRGIGICIAIDSTGDRSAVDCLADGRRRFRRMVRLVPRARPECRRAQQLVSEAMVDPRTCEAVPVAILGGVGRTRLSLRVYLEMCALTKGGRSCGWTLLSGDLHGQFKGGFMVDYGIGLGGAEPVLVQGGAKVDWFDSRNILDRVKISGRSEIGKVSFRSDWYHYKLELIAHSIPCAILGVVIPDAMYLSVAEKSLIIPFFIGSKSLELRSDGICFVIWLEEHKPGVGRVHTTGVYPTALAWVKSTDVHICAGTCQHHSHNGF
ncbi:hypothetical protein LguiB_012688 [Lonicera macranthoides]